MLLDWKRLSHIKLVLIRQVLFMDDIYRWKYPSYVGYDRIYINSNNLSGLLLFINFEKAFDKIEWSFMFECMQFFYFGHSFISWVKILYNDISSCSINNGYASEFFPVNIKSLVLSQQIFIFSVLPNPPDDFIKAIEKTIYSFVWNGKPDKINRQTLIGDYGNGGLKMPHIPSVLSGLKIAWVKRSHDSPNKGIWKCFFDHHVDSFGGNIILWHCNVDPGDANMKKIRNHFIKDVFQSWCSFAFSRNIKLC